MSDTVFNWAKQNQSFDISIGQSGTKEQFAMKDVYHDIWVAVLGSDEGFEHFFNDCLTKEEIEIDGKKFKVNGETFAQVVRSKVLLKIKNSDPSFDETIENASEDAIKNYFKSRYDDYNKAADKSGNVKESIVASYLGLTAAKGFLPYDTVTTSGAMVATGNHLQMGCGEGKTTALQFASIYYAQKGQQVFLTSSTEELAEDSFYSSVAEYDMLDLGPKDPSGMPSTDPADADFVLITTTKIVYKFHGSKAKEIELGSPLKEDQKEAIKKAYSKKIVFADNATVMQHEMLGLIPKPKTPKKILLADEADFVLLDQYRSMQLIDGVYDKNENAKRNLYRSTARTTILELVKDKSLYTIDDSNQYVDYTTSGKKYISDVINNVSKKIKDFDKQLFYEMAYEALVVETVYKKVRDYQIIEDRGKKRIISEDRASGAKIELPQGIQQALEIKEFGDYEKINFYRKTARKVILNLVRDKSLYKIDYSNKTVDYTERGKKYFEKVVNKVSEKIKDFDKQLFYETAYDALVVETVYKKDRDYQIIEDRGKKCIISEDFASGTKIELPQGIQQALEVKEFGDYEEYENFPEGRVVKQTNITSTIASLFESNVICVSGTLNTSKSSAQAEELEALHINTSTIYSCPPKKKNSRKREPSRIYANRVKLRDGVCDQAIAVANSNDEKHWRPVIIGCVSAEEVMAISANLTKKLDQTEASVRVIEYTAASEDVFKRDKEIMTEDAFVAKYGVKKDDYNTFYKYVKKYCGTHKVILVGTSIMGRGTTIATNDDVKKHGGIHVIINGLHETSSRNQIQYAARTARGDDPGSYEEFMCKEDFSSTGIEIEGFQDDKPDYIVEEPNDHYDRHFEIVDTRQSNIRKHINNLNAALKASYKEIERVIVSKENEFKGSEFKLKERIVSAQALLTARANSILNRACGYAGNEKSDEYIAELKAWTLVYCQRFSQETPSNFNEYQFIENKISEQIHNKDKNSNTDDQIDYCVIADYYYAFSNEKEIIDNYKKYHVTNNSTEIGHSDDGFTM